MKILLSLFVPCEQNKYKAWLARPIIYGSLFGLMGIIGGLGMVKHEKYSMVQGVATNLTEAEVIRLTNEQRQAAQIPTLVPSEKLSKAAQIKAQNMVEHGVFDHYYETDGRPITPWYFFDLVGYRYLHAGENLGRDFDTSDSLVQAWMQSPKHRENLMSPEYLEIGVGIVEGPYLDKKSTTLVVQLFATPTNDLVGDIITKPDDNYKSAPIVSHKNSWISQALRQYPAVFWGGTLALTIMIFVALIIDLSLKRPKSSNNISADFWKN